MKPLFERNTCLLSQCPILMALFFGGVRKAISPQSQDFFLIPSSVNLEYFDPLVA